MVFEYAGDRVFRSEYRGSCEAGWEYSERGCEACDPEVTGYEVHEGGEKVEKVL
jgi:hypothetical protein